MEPRWPANTAFDYRLRFLGCAGPLDLWLDTEDTGLAPYAYVWSDDYAAHDWAKDPSILIVGARDAYNIHMTLHDECMVYQLCEV